MSKIKNNVTGSNKGEFIRVCIDGYAHLVLKKYEVKSLHSWTNIVKKSFIKITLKDHEGTAQYADRTLWKEILKQLNELIQ